MNIVRGASKRVPQQKLGWQFTAGCELWKSRSVFDFLFHFWLPIPKIYWKVYVLRVEVSCGDSGLWFGPIKKKNLSTQVRFKSDKILKQIWKNVKNGKNKFFKNHLESFGKYQ